MIKMTILQKKSARRDGFFETNLDFINHPLQVFWNFPPTFPQYFQIFLQISIFWEFRYLCLKFGTFCINIHGEKCFQNCTLFGSFFNFHIVQWLVVFHLAMVLSAWQQPAAAAAEAAACRRLLQSAVQRPSAAPRLHPPFLLLLLRPYLLLPPLD